MLDWCLNPRTCGHLHCYPSNHAADALDDEEGDATSLEACGCDIVYLRRKAGEARVVVTNYHAFHYSGHHFGARDILWFDEAQHMPIPDVTLVRVPRWAIPEGLLARLVKMQDLDNITAESLEATSDQLNRNKGVISEAIQAQEREWDFPEAAWTWDNMYSNRSFTLNDRYLECRYINLGEMGLTTFMNRGTTSIAMSGTLVDGRQIGANGLDVVKFAPTLPSPEVVAWRKRDSDRRIRFERTIEAIDTHQGERGVAFFSSRHETELFAMTYPSNRWVVQQTPGARRETAELAQSKDGVLLTYGGHEGLDLVDELARFGVLVKMPFLNLADQHVKAEFEVKKWNWYNRECGLKVRQAAGRLIRHQGDFGVFYMADRGSRRFPHSKTWANEVMGVHDPEDWTYL